MNIAFFYKYFPSLGGVERVMTVMANELVDRGENVIIYSYKQNTEKLFYSLNKNIKIVPLPDVSLMSDVNVDFLVKDLIRNEISILLNHDSVKDSMQLCKKIKENTSISLVTLHHGQIYLSWLSLKSIVYGKQNNSFNIRAVIFPLYFLYVNLKRYFHHINNINISDAYIVLSETFKRQLGHNSKLEVIGNPLSYSSFFDMDQYEKKHNRVVIVGRISDSNKRISMALKIWEGIEHNVAFDSWNLDIIGEGEDIDLIKNMIVDLKLERVNMVGYTEPEKYYKEAKLLFMTSAFEGFPLVLMEASQNACIPIVMDSFESVYDMITSGVNGYIIPNNDVYLFGQTVETLMNDYDLLCKMASEAVMNSHRYTPTTLLDKWITLFRKLNRI